MKTINEIIKALRCTSTPRHKYDCENCPYRELNEVNDDIPIKEDVIIDGKKYWEGCDVEKIAIDAADLLEKIQRNMESDINFLKRKEEEAEKNAKVETEPTLKAYYDGKAEGFYVAIALTENTKQRIDADAETEEAEKRNEVQ